MRSLVLGPSDGRLQLFGRLPLHQIRVSVVPSTLELSRAQLSLLPRRVAELREEGKVVTDGPTYRLENWLLEGGLHLQVSERSYFDSVLLKRYPEWGLRSRVLAVATVMECPEGFLMEKRSQQVAAAPGMWHPCPSGSMEPGSSPLDTLLKEAHEELSLEPKEIQEATCVGLLLGETTGVFQLIASARTDVSLGDIRKRVSRDAWERVELVAVPTEPESLSDWIALHEGRLTAGGRTALAAVGGLLWGEEWMEDQLS